MNTNTGELGELSELLQTATDPTDVAPIPKELRALARRHRGKFVNMQGNSPLAQFGRDHQRRKKQKKAKARGLRKQVKRTRRHLRSRHK